MPGQRIDITSNNAGSKINPLNVAVIQDPQNQNIRVKGDHVQQVSVLTTATKIAEANPFRRSLLLANLTGTQIVYLGTDKTVSSSTGRAFLTGAVGSSITINAHDEIWGIAAVATQTVTVWDEEFQGVL